MAWRAILMRFPEDIELSDLSSDWKPLPLGTPEEVKVAFENIFPNQYHVLGQTHIKTEGMWAKFDYATSDDGGVVHMISVQSNAGPGAAVAMKSICERFDCRMADLQTGEFADFAEKTDTSMIEFRHWRRRTSRQMLCVFAAATVAVILIHLAQDSGAIPATKALSKPMMVFYGISGLVTLNLLLFTGSLFGAMKDVSAVEREDLSDSEKEERGEEILVPAFQGQRPPPMIFSRLLPIPTGAFFGMIAGSIVAAIVSALFF